MSEPTLDILTQRLARLERENRRLKGLGAVALVGIVALVLMGHSAEGRKVVEADQFVLRLPDGQVRGELNFVGDGAVRLALYDRDRTRRLQLVVAVPDGAPALTFYDKNSQPRALLALKNDGTPQLEFYDKDGRPLWKAP